MSAGPRRHWGRGRARLRHRWSHAARGRVAVDACERSAIQRCVAASARQGRHDSASVPSAARENTPSGQGTAKAEVGDRERVAFAEPEGEIVRSPRSQTIDCGDGRGELVKSDAAVEPNRVVGDGASEGADRLRLCPREPEAGEVGRGKRARRGKRVRQAEPPESGHFGAVSLDEPPGDRVRRHDGHMLADDRAHAGLEGTP